MDILEILSSTRPLQHLFFPLLTQRVVKFGCGTKTVGLLSPRLWGVAPVPNERRQLEEAEQGWALSGFGAREIDQCHFNVLEAGAVLVMTSISTR